MKNWRQFLRNYWQVLAAAIAIIILLIVVNATGGSPQLAGSTYSNQPNGYGAWYQMMIDRQVPIDRWRRSSKELIRQHPSGSSLLRVYSEVQDLEISKAEQDWIKKGNTLIVLGVDAPAQDISFSQDLASDQGKVRIESTRRFESKTLPDMLSLVKSSQRIVGDKAGDVVVSAKIGEGQLIAASTNHLAANAYQDFRPNYELLASLVNTKAKTKEQRILVDEYLHGFRDTQSSELADRPAQDGLTYLLRTPWLVVLCNLCLVLGILIWQQNRRFGAVVMPQPPAIDNSRAYIQALGGVLRQARSSDFVVQNIGKAELLAIQQQLGLGNQQLVDRQTLLTAWAAHTKLPADDLQQVLQLATGARQRLTESELRQWLLKMQAVRDQLQQPSL